MVKKWYKPRGKSMVLMEEEEIEKLIEKRSKSKSQSKTKVTKTPKKTKVKESK